MLSICKKCGTSNETNNIHGITGNQKILKIVNQKPIEEARNFYRAVMKLHHPDYVEMIEEFKY